MSKKQRVGTVPQMAARLEAVRRNKGLLVRELANELGVSTATLKRWRRNTSLPRFDDPDARRSANAEAVQAFLEENRDFDPSPDLQPATE